MANIRLIFSKNNGTLGKTGSLDFIFERKGVFKIPADNLNVEELELELIDFGAEEIFQDENEIFIYTAFSDFGSMQKALETKGINIISAELQRIPNSTAEVTKSQEESILAFIDKLEEDDDVQAVYHNMK